MMRSRLQFLLLGICLVAFPCSTFSADAADSADANSVLDGETLIHDQWFNGYLNKQPALRAHEIITERTDKTRSFLFDMEMKISRKLFGLESVISMQQKRKFIESTDGLIESFYFENNENGKIISATGKVVGNQVLATIVTPTGSMDRAVTIPDGEVLRGQLGGQTFMNEQLKQVGDSIKTIGIEMIAGQIKVITTTAKLEEIKANGNKVFSARIDLMPTVPVSIEVDKHGHTQEMSMSMGGVISMTFKTTDEPMQLEAADFKISNMINHKGGPPKIGSNRYRIKAATLANIQDDEFQAGVDDILSITNQAKKTTLAQDHGFLAPELQLEIEDPSMIAWAQKKNVGHEEKSIAEQAEILRLAVRSHITKKDLSQGDASALETFKSRCGDCTEHANLLCAALRINGIPSRTEVGFVYVAKIRSWVGHAWTSAYDQEQGRWIHLDAAYPGIQRSQYIKTGSTSGGENGSTAEAMTRGVSALMGQEVEVLP